PCRCEHSQVRFSGPMFSRYWQHYHQAMSWQQRHRRAYWKAMEAAGGPLCWQQQRPDGGRQRPDGGRQRPDGGRQRPDGGRRYEDWHVEDEEEDDGEDSGSEIECDVSNMEISQELRQYFAETERHREELKRQQQMEAERQDSYVPADQDLHAASWRRSAAPPLERPGERRAAEMKKLYGKDAPRILAMEAAMQLTFDRNCDRKQPRYWPVIPLKL
uniref:Gem (nuclear organelle) associated protein 8 n=1 Tax=Oryzias latipes TaxID=8090 RepID=H2LQF0_ORYLA